MGHLALGTNQGRDSARLELGFDGQGLPYLLHVVDAQHAGALLGAPQACRERAAEPLLGAHVVDRLQEGLAAHAHHDRHAQIGELM
jgi:hypothetical protein